ncbi:probable cytochrome P450 304a1 [Condylostylus longicornis]|uniref:probable cytochrome P450 304a1 n=1 Tax=Condylostylus longicornis TaxID=2530218 RepID=UPI00244E3D0B|nr:probable cytochrome P450 304a1 [Condylostylus longicornis]
MVSPIILTIFIAIIIYIALKWSFEKPKNFPPGPPRIPLFGAYLFLLAVNYQFLHKAALFFSKLYKSDTIGLYLGEYKTIIANSQEGVRQILFRKDFDGRPDIYAGRLRDPHFNRRGIFFNDGILWKDQRRFVLRYLRDFGFGRRFDELEAVMNEELTDLVELIRNGPKYPHEKEFVRDKLQACCPNFMSACSTNSFLYIMCNERVPREEREICNKLVKDGMIFQRAGDDYGRLLSFLPWIRHFFPYKSGYRQLRDSTKTLWKFFKTYVDKNLETYNEDYDRNFMDMYIREMKKAEKENEVDSTFFYDQFVLSLVDFAFPAITAVGVQLSMLFQWFLLRPELLKNVQEELDRVVGRGRLASLDDRKNLSYTEACLREILRIETLVPSSVPHRALVDTEFLGYKIEKDTIMVPGLYAFHMDARYWQDPEIFKPERFLDENNTLSLKKDISLPFGAGKRLCAGETFARNMMFLILCAICQNFNIVLGPGQELPDMSKNVSGIIQSPPDFWIYFENR